MGGRQRGSVVKPLHRHFHVVCRQDSALKVNRLALVHLKATFQWANNAWRLKALRLLRTVTKYRTDVYLKLLKSHSSFKIQPFKPECYIYSFILIAQYN